MKNHPEIKWTEIVRRAIGDYLVKIEKPREMAMKEFREQLRDEALALLADVERDGTSIETELATRKAVHDVETARIRVRQQLERGEK